MAERILFPNYIITFPNYVQRERERERERENCFRFLRNGNGGRLKKKKKKKRKIDKTFDIYTLHVRTEEYDPGYRRFPP